MTIRIGTRGSKLALWQAEWTADQLRGRGHEVTLEIISTRGDVSKESLKVVGGQGLFTKEIQRALLAENVDLAIHSLKDLPTETIDGLVLGAVPDRETTRDCLVSRKGEAFEQLPAGARIGTGSLRRGAQLLRWRSDIEIADIRGNVDSRLRKVEEGQYDAIILAAAGLARLKLTAQVTEVLPEERMLPAIGQGALGIECRTDDDATRQAVLSLDHSESHAAVMAERSFLASLLAGCLAPVAAIARVKGDELLLRGRVIAADASDMVEGEASGPLASAQDIGRRLAEELKTRGAVEIIAAARQP